MRAAAAILALLLCSQPALAADAKDASLQGSLKAFFAQGIHLQGATAALADMPQLPNAKGPVHWSMPPTQYPASHLALIAEQSHNGQVQRWYVPVHLHWWVDAVVAESNLQVSSLLSPDLLQHARVDVADHAGFWWTHVNDLTGMRLTRSIRSGQPIFNSDVQRPPLVRYGDEVNLIAIIGGIRVTALGKVLDTASKGDSVMVQNMSSKQTVQAIIVNKNTARIMLGGV
jgi:flagella basal body P-ring formation protein FlgA